MRKLCIGAAATILMNALCAALLFLGLEAFLRIHAASQAPVQATPAFVVPPPSGNTVEIPPDLIEIARARHAYLTMPEEWQRRIIDRGEGYIKEMWHGVLQLYNGDHMRRIDPFPPKRDGVFRVMVLGDSLTYGPGVAEEWTYPALLNKWLAPQVEVLNLAISGNQTEDTLRILRRYLPILKPDLVFYGVCHNDFLPSGRGQYHYRTAYSVPLPEAVTQFLLSKTIAGPFIAELYDATLRYFHLRNDFVTDILTDFESYQTRFARDVAEMNRFVTGSGLPPMLAMVLDQDPGYGNDLHRITRIAEQALTRAGVRVIPTEDYYRRYHASHMFVSRWEAHPDERAFFVWASMIAPELRAK